MTDEELDDLIEEWHFAEVGDAAYQYSLEEWMRMHTNWTNADFEYWVTTGKRP